MIVVRVGLLIPFAVLLIVVLPPGAAAQFAGEPQPATAHVRSAEPELVELLAEGVGRSPSLRALTAVLDESDVIVYLQCETDPRVVVLGMDARLMFLSRVAGRRYLVARIRCSLSQEAQLPLMAHELRHAVEIAAAPQVVDIASMTSHYERIGIETTPAACRARTFETRAAQKAERSVRRELHMKVTNGS